MAPRAYHAATLAEVLRPSAQPASQHADPELHHMLREVRAGARMPFFVVNLDAVTAKHQQFVSALPRIKPFYGARSGTTRAAPPPHMHRRRPPHACSADAPHARPAVKCNPNLVMLEHLAGLGANFDVASRAEMQAVMEKGADASRIIFANPCKAPSHVRFASACGVRMMTFDSEEEVHKVASLFPDAQLVLRLKVRRPRRVCRAALPWAHGATLLPLPAGG